MSFLKKLVHSITGVPPKYEFTNVSIHVDGFELRRIRALRKISLKLEGRSIFVNPGDMGGFLEYSGSSERSAYHLPHDDESWIGGNAQCFDLAKLTDNSFLTDNAVLRDQAELVNAYVGGSSKISGKARILFSVVLGSAKINGRVIANNAIIIDNATLDGNIDIWNSSIYDRGSIKVVGEFSGVRMISVAGCQIHGDAVINHPIYDMHSGLLHNEKLEGVSICSGVINSDASITAARKNGNLKKVDERFCIFDHTSGPSFVIRVLPDKIFNF